VLTFNTRYQEDAHSICSIKLNPSILRRTAERVEKSHHWDPIADDEFAYQVLFAGIYDGEDKFQIPS
jgi:hypothetical protein